MIKKFFRDYSGHKKIVPFFDLLFLLRPTLFFPVWIMITVGMAAAQMDISRYQIWITDFDLTTIALFIGITLLSGSAFIINQIKDKDSDEINKKLFLVGNYISVERANKIMWITLIAGFVFLIIDSFYSLIIGGFLYLLWGVLYNMKPFHWKKKPILGMIANTLAGFMIFFSGWVHVYAKGGFGLKEILTLKMILFAIPYLLCYTAVSMLTTLPDLKGDDESGAITFPLKFGFLTTVIIATFFVILAFFMGMQLNDPVSTTAALVSSPFYFVALVRMGITDVLRAIRFSIFILAFFVIAVYPWLFPAVLIVYYLSKYYYWHRFDLHYPTFIVEDDDQD